MLKTLLIAAALITVGVAPVAAEGSRTPTRPTCPARTGKEGGRIPPCGHPHFFAPAAVPLKARQSL